MNSPRLVSVIIATRDRPALLREALASVRALEGSDITFQIRVGDNGSAAGSREAAEEFGAIYAKTETNGCASARNVAMRNASGEFIAFLDDDDVWLEGHIRPHIRLLDARPELEAVFGQVIPTNVDRSPTSAPWPVELPNDGDIFKTMMSGYFPQVGATLVRARALKTYGLMDERLIGDSDWDWQLRIARNHRIGFVPVPCVLFRQRPPGTYDELQMRRMTYTRRIFLRHAIPEWKRWQSPVAMLRSYFGSVGGYHSYFLESAVQRSADGERRAALKAIVSAVWIKPFNGVKQLIKPTQFRKAFLTALSPRPHVRSQASSPPTAKT
ncbi:MAG: glycosyltransferase family 2 protein [Chitinophagales bacterium]|nr:glycosyltransferase family 2 protein [Hyphomicrobiales bacterium]